MRQPPFSDGFSQPRTRPAKGKAGQGTREFPCFSTIWTILPDSATIRQAPPQLLRISPEIDVFSFDIRLLIALSFANLEINLPFLCVFRKHIFSPLTEQNISPYNRGS